MMTIRTNLVGLASSQRIGLDLNSMVNFNGIKIGAGATGMFQMGSGVLDGEERIEAYFELGTTNLETDKPKRVRYLFLSFESAADMQIDVSVDQGAVREYIVKANKTAQQRSRVTVGRDGKGTYWTFTIRNIRGADFAVDMLKALPVVKSHGFI